jgi:hypothetical protein
MTKLCRLADTNIPLDPTIPGQLNSYVFSCDNCGFAGAIAIGSELGAIKRIFLLMEKS